LFEDLDKDRFALSRLNESDENDPEKLTQCFKMASKVAKKKLVQSKSHQTQIQIKEKSKKPLQ